MLSISILIFFTLVCIAIFIFGNSRNRYWSNLKVDGPRAFPIVGNLFSFVVLRKKHVGEIFDEIYDYFKTAKYVGFYKLNQPALIIRDLDIVRSIMVSNFNVFNKNDFYLDPKLNPLFIVNPFLSHGDTWKQSRAIVSPLFSPNRTKAAFPFVEHVSRTMENYLNANHKQRNGVFEVKELSNQFTIDVIVNYGLSVNGNSFSGSSDFNWMGGKISKPTFINGLTQQIVLFMPFFNKFLKIPFLSKDVDQRFRSIIRQIYLQRKDAYSQPDDLLKSILENCEKYENTEFDENFVAGHSLSVLRGAWDTSSTTMAYLLFELACNSEIQQRVQQEVDSVFEEFGSEFTQKVAENLTFLENCIFETARMHPPFFHTSRIALQDFELPSQYDDSDEKILIKAGTIVVIPIQAIHNDAKYFHDPDQFIPERFSEENRHLIYKNSFLGFGDGPRKCLGQTFGIMQVKCAIARIMANYSVQPTKSTDIPEKFSKVTFNRQPVNGIELKFIRRDKKFN